MPSPSKNKGSRIEREIAQLFVDLGFVAHRVDERAGQLGKESSADVDIFIDGENRPPWKAEIKARKNGEGFATLDKWIGPNELLILRKDRSKPSVYMPWETLERLLAYVEGE